MLPWDQKLVGVSWLVNDRMPVIKYLLKKGATFDARDKAGETPLHIAAAFENIDVVGCNIEIGAEMNSQNHENVMNILTRTAPTEVPEHLGMCLHPIP